MGSLIELSAGGAGAGDLADPGAAESRQQSTRPIRDMDCVQSKDPGDTLDRLGLGLLVWGGLDGAR